MNGKKMSKPKQLLITADDFGICNAIDQGIYDSLPSLDCIDVVVNYESTESMKKHFDGSDKSWDRSSKERIIELVNHENAKDRILSGDLKIGLHLTLNCGSSLSLNASEPTTKAEFLLRRKLCRKVRSNSNVWEFKNQGVPAIARKLDDLKRIRNKHQKYFLKDELEAQYNRFLDIMTDAGLSGYKPFHISSHNGIYGGTEYTYELLREFCNEKNVEMRCPSLIGHNQDPKLKAWRKEGTKMVSDFEFAALGLFGLTGVVQNAHGVRRWLKQLDTKVHHDRIAGELHCTEFFVEHYFLKGDLHNLQSIFLRIKNTSSKRDQTYEMVVHPVCWDNNSNKNHIPRGLKHGKFYGKFEKRNKEHETLKKMDVRQMKGKFGITAYQSGWKPSIKMH